MWRDKHVFMDAAGSEGAGSGGVSSGGNGSAAGGTTDAGAGGAVVPGTAPEAGSVLAAGASGSLSTSDFIPEKYRVTGEDGALDLEASARKLAEAYGHAEKRIGAGDLPPKEASEYKVTVPDTLKEAFDPATDEGMQKFLAGAHEKKFTQAQLDYVIQNYFELAPQLVAGAKQYDADAATAELKKTWATDADFSRNVRNAFVGVNAAAQKAGITVDEIMASPLANDPMFLKLFAALGPEFNEDAPPGGEQFKGEEDVNTMMASEAYTNPKHPDHAKVSERVRKYFERKHGTEAAA